MEEGVKMDSLNYYKRRVEELEKVARKADTFARMFRSRNATNTDDDRLDAWRELRDALQAAGLNVGLRIMGPKRQEWRP